MTESARATQSVPMQRRHTTRVRNISKAKNRAAQEVAFFTGEDAILEVIKDDGAWNWVLIGPDPETLPLSGGGPLGIDEMQGALGNMSHSFGLLRMSFGVGADNVTKWLFIHAVDEDNNAGASRMERGQAAAMEPQMEEAIRKFVPFSAKVNIQSREDCTVDVMLEKLTSVVNVMDSAMLTKENFNASFQDYLDKHPDLKEKVQKQQKHAKQLETVAAPRSEAASLEAEQQPVGDEPSLRRQRTKVKLYAKGDVVEVYSVNHKKWFLDAEIIDVVRETAYFEGVRVSAGSMKIAYDNGTRYKWVAPHEASEVIRESTRPRPPDVMVGDMFKEQNLLILTRWQKVYIELHKGFLQWWWSQDDAKNAKPPVGSTYLLGLQQQDMAEVFKLRTESSNGAVFAFQAPSLEECVNWVDALWAHAGYCEEVAEFYEAKLGGMMVRKELMNVMMRRELVSLHGGKKKSVMAG